MVNAVPGANHMCNGVGKPDLGVAEGHASDCGGDKHLSPGRKIPTVLDRVWKPAADEPNGVQAKGIGDGRALRRCDCFHAVRERIHASGGGEKGREPDRKDRVQDRNMVKQVMVRKEMSGAIMTNIRLISEELQWIFQPRSFCGKTEFSVFFTVMIKSC
jgi:hypothetical protein